MEIGKIWIFKYVQRNDFAEILFSSSVNWSIVTGYYQPTVSVNQNVRFHQKLLVPYYVHVKSFISDFSELPFSLVYSVEDPSEKLDVLNSSIGRCLDKHAPLTRIRITRPQAPWMKDLDIRNLQAQRDIYRYDAHQTGTNEDWQLFKNVRNQLKRVIKETKKRF